MHKTTPLTFNQQKVIRDHVSFFNRLARQHAKSAQEADDFRSAIYLAVCAAIQNWTPESISFKIWVTRIAHRACRRERAFHAVPLHIPETVKRVEIASLANNEENIDQLFQLLKKKFPRFSEECIREGLWYGAGPRAGTSEGFRREEFVDLMFATPCGEGLDLVEVLTKWRDTLPEKTYRIVEKYLTSPLNYREIGCIENMSYEAIRGHVDRAIALLKQLISEQ